MTALLVLAIGASSALVFTNRAELLKLAVLLALWAAVVAAFVSVIYRRQSDSDQAKVRDLKLVYDLQLEREISARREYELAVETQLRRELTAELRSQSSDEVSALRAELAALRANLEYLFDTDLSHRHAIETDRTSDRVYGEWTPGADTAGRVHVSRIDVEDVEEVFDDRSHGPATEESPIIDVPAEPHLPEVGQTTPAEAGGAHRRFSQDVPASAHRADGAAGPPSPPPPPPPPPKPENAPPPPAPEPLYPWLPPPPEPAKPEPAAPTGAHRQPAAAEGAWNPPGVRGTHGEEPRDDRDEYVGRRRAPEEPLPAANPPRGRHYASPSEATHGKVDVPEAPAPHPAPSTAEPDLPEDGDGGAHTGGPSVAELLARLQTTPSGGGRRRRRED